MLLTRLGLVITLAMAASGPLQPRNAEGSLAVQERWQIGGEGGWNRLAADPLFHRLYVTRGNRVTVVDTKTGKASGEMAGFENVRSVCLDDSGAFGYITDGARNLVQVFDRATLRVVASLPTGLGPDAAVFDSASHSVFVFNHRSNSATVIDALSNSVVGSIDIPGKPASAASDEKGALFVTLEDKAQIIRIDTQARVLATAWSIGSCVGPNGVAFDSERDRIYTACENDQLAVLDGSTGKVLATSDLGDGARDVVFDPHRKLILAVNAGGTITVLRDDPSGRLVPLQKVETQAGARMLALDATRDRIYLATAQFGMRTGETSEELLYRPTPAPGTFVVLVVGE